MTDGTALDKIDASETAKAAYAALLDLLAGIGLYEVEAKKTSLHITNGRAFLGVHPRSGGLLLNLVTDAPLGGERVRRTERVSRNRCHSEVLVASAGDLDEELAGWIRRAYELTDG